MNTRYWLGVSLGAVTAAAFLGLTPASVSAQEILLRTQVPNTEDEDYDGMIVFKDYVEAQSNGAIGVEILLGSQLSISMTVPRLLGLA